MTDFVIVKTLNVACVIAGCDRILSVQSFACKLQENHENECTGQQSQFHLPSLFYVNCLQYKLNKSKIMKCLRICSNFFPPKLNSVECTESIESVEFYF